MKNSRISKRIILMFLGTILSLSKISDTHASEGAASMYFPGAYATFLATETPPPGVMLANQVLTYAASTSRASLQGRVNTDIETIAIFDLITGFYTFDQKILGATFQIGGFLPIGYSSLDADITSSLGTKSISESDTNIGDMAIQPIGLYWNKGKWGFKFEEFIYVPTGHYDINNTVNVGRNYWGFDSDVTVSWFNPDSGTEITALPGIMANTTNNETDYTTGTEFHLDYMLNQFLSKEFAVGFQGYYYKQISDDSGSGAILGGFKGESIGLGAAVLWVPKFANEKLSVAGKWLHDIDATNRMKADYGQLTVGYQL